LLRLELKLYAAAGAWTQIDQQGLICGVPEYPENLRLFDPRSRPISQKFDSIEKEPSS
jgi:hypothetical protein